MASRPPKSTRTRTAKEVRVSPRSLPRTHHQNKRPRRILHLLQIYLSILLLFVNYFLAQYDKFILSYFRPQVQASLGLSEAQYGLVSGYATGIVYALLALPIALVADYTSARVWTLSVAAAWWSLCVVFQGLANDFGQLFCARIGMGIGQAAVEALSISLISDLVAWRNVFLGTSVLYVGVYVGEAVSGQIAHAFTETGTSWQVAMRAIGITGIVVAVLVRLVLREPARREAIVVLGGRPGAWDAASSVIGSGVGPVPGSKARKRRSMRAAKADLLSTGVYIMRMHSFWLLLLSAAMRQLAGNVFGYYMPGYLSTLYPNTTNLLSRYGLIVGIVGSLTVLFGGLLTSLLWNRTKLTPIYLTAVGGMVSSIFVLIMIFSRNLAGDDESRGVQILYGSMAAAYATAELWLGCLFALIALLLPPDYKTFGLAIWTSVQVLVYSSGPEAMGLALRNEDPASPGYITATRNSLAVIITLGYWACGIGLLSAIPLLKRDLRMEFVEGRLSTRRRMAFGGFIVAVVCLVVILFTMSLVYAV
ncbi:major facilitator superfamily domain-containing protein [Emericellopsis atlantica]|uniref:Major facilitator superfamily domain-containing protein n=1 Tax=Emericellopsis atlantica TaxID=2614577 RepID=A0A9P8CJL9_9HYPO|nr:major facilitator superfamily domain-containing protein [Emericellopsis atlantica]KAG9249478.1 major facilitator superfamily domain-containing protein [Emericellopsis atlantica]